MSWFEMSKSPILVTCAKGIAPFLADELRALGMPVLTERETGVETEGTPGDAMNLNLHIRTGYSVLFLFKAFRAATPEALYWQTLKIPWEELIPADGYVTVDSWVRTESIRDWRYANVKCKDAIVDRIRNECGRRPDSGSAGDRAGVFLYWQGHECRLYLNTSGEPLSKRGYRRIPLGAPMQETLAAAAILATGWNGHGHFVNPMCGSGTLAIEAAMIGIGRAPGLLRENFGFMHLKGFDPGPWKALREAAKKAARKSPDGRIVATDRDPRAVDAARQNARTAGVERLIEFAVCDFAGTPAPEGEGVVILNPEYGARMGSPKELEGEYRRIGDFFKQKCGGYTGYVFTGNLDLAKKVGLRTRRKIPFFNGSIECRLLKFELYPGTKRTFGAPKQAAGSPHGDQD